MNYRTIASKTIFGMAFTLFSLSNLSALEEQDRQEEFPLIEESGEELLVQEEEQETTPRQEFWNGEGASSSSSSCCCCSGSTGTTPSPINTTGTYLYTHSDLDSERRDYNGGEAIIFDGGVVVGGTALARTDNTTVTISAAGAYSVRFIGQTWNSYIESEGITAAQLADSDYTASVAFYVNDMIASHPTEVQLRGGPVVLEAIIPITTVPSTLQVRVGGGDTGDILSLNEDSTASLVIIKLTPDAAT